jgi:hypothetical protein
VSDEALADFFLASDSTVWQLQLLEISHSAFSKTHRIVQNHPDGVMVDIGGVEGVKIFDYFPLRISRGTEGNDLSQTLQIDLGDLGEVWPTELDLVFAADASDEKPRVRYWTYRSDDLTAPLTGPLELEVGDFSYAREGVSFEARAPKLNVLGTGELYTVDRFQMLRALL